MANTRWSPEADLLCVWLAGGVYQYEMQQIRQNPEENNRKIKQNSKRCRNSVNGAWFFDQDVFVVVANFMNALNEIVPFESKRTISSLALRNHLGYCQGDWKRPAKTLKRAETVLPDHILPGEFGQFGLRAVLEATIALVPDAKNDTSEWRNSLWRWKGYFPELEMPAARSTVQETALTQRDTSWELEVPVRDHMIDPNSYQGTFHKAGLDQPGFEHQSLSYSGAYGFPSEIYGDLNPSWNPSTLSDPSQYNLLPQNSMESDLFGPYGHSIPQSNSGGGVPLHSSNQYSNPSTYYSNSGEFNSHQFPSQFDSGGGAPLNSSNQYPSASTHTSNFGDFDPPHILSQSNSGGDGTSRSFHSPPDPWGQNPSQGYHYTGFRDL
ncbi:hypothetical protein OCU04_006192 [Sclerotinia nivalis]|uniref:Uncharacterized protein n=1 Tax=Sclerotinia nivalis TaxID=352851 RepID=A0A9X0AMH2_9HELO|nr:hypothetical protein OCU04_006192 [Sclerotinia nivalis]